MDTTTNRMSFLSMTGIDNVEENRLGIELINGEIGTIDTEIDTLTTNLATEVSDRTTADTNLANDLSFETTSRVAQDSILSTSIGEVEADLATEITDRTTADTTLQTNITTVSNGLTTETTNRSTADANLQSQIDDLETDLATETTSRVAEDASLLSSIGDVEDDLATEITNRTNADTTLQTNINSINTTINGMVDDFSNQTIAGTKTFDSGNETYLQLTCDTHNVAQYGQTTFQATLNLLEDYEYENENDNYGGYIRYYEGGNPTTNELQIGTREGTNTHDAITIPRGNTAITMERDVNIDGDLNVGTTYLKIRTDDTVNTAGDMNHLYNVFNLIETDSYQGANQLLNSGQAGYNSIQATGLSGYNSIEATGTNGSNDIKATLENTIYVGSVEKIKTTSTANTITNDTINLVGATNITGDVNITGNLIADGDSHNRLISSKTSGATGNLIHCDNGADNVLKTTSAGTTQIKIGSTTKVEVGDTTTTLTNTDINFNGSLTVFGNMEIAGKLDCSKVVNPFFPDNLSTDWIENDALLEDGYWYRIASNSSGRRSWGASFVLSVNDGGSSGGEWSYLEFKCSNQLGYDSNINVVQNSNYSASKSFTKIRCVRTDETGIPWADSHIDVFVGIPSSGQIGANNCKLFMYNNFCDEGLTLQSFATIPTGESYAQQYICDITNTLFSVGRDADTSILEVKEGGVDIAGDLTVGGNVKVGASPLLSMVWYGFMKTANNTSGDIIFGSNLDNANSNPIQWLRAPCNLKLEVICVNIDDDGSDDSSPFLQYNDNILVAPDPDPYTNGVMVLKQKNNSYNLYENNNPPNYSSTTLSNIKWEQNGGVSTSQNTYLTTNYLIPKDKLFGCSFSNIGIGNKDAEISFIFYFSQY